MKVSENVLFQKEDELRVTFNLESHKATLFESENINEEL